MGALPLHNAVCSIQDDLSFFFDSIQDDLSFFLIFEQVLLWELFHCTTPYADTVRQSESSWVKLGMAIYRE